MGLRDSSHLSVRRLAEASGIERAAIRRRQAGSAIPFASQIGKLSLDEISEISAPQVPKARLSPNSSVNDKRAKRGQITPDSDVTCAASFRRCQIPNCSHRRTLAAKKSMGVSLSGKPLGPPAGCKVDGDLAKAWPFHPLEWSEKAPCKWCCSTRI